MVKLQLRDVVLASLFATPILAGNSVGFVYGYECYDCGCNAYQQNTFVNPGNSGACYDLSQGSASTGIDRTSVYDKMDCVLYTGYKCTGSSYYQAERYRQDWNCQNSKIGWINSWQCWT
ncbi:uncharacterized protein N7482_007374 [Penicillium canariense]|uniref:Secreted protein n=1 Tax=Penicillium canariense TaxID=189055 RepID=A0A9W9LJT1_9EURO|nr:uncharacterized protein N7482_007374 [Penicillium canariense]KAJ5160370.1 hypothetical protein N7482_007374 [Penicillium canariense]